MIKKTVRTTTFVQRGLNIPYTQNPKIDGFFFFLFNKLKNLIKTILETFKLSKQVDNLLEKNMHAPIFLIKLPNEIVLNSNDKLILFVKVSAIPNANFLWTINGNPIETLNSYEIFNENNCSKLIVYPPVCIGNYNVEAKNMFGSIINENDTKVYYSNNNSINEQIQNYNLLEGYIYTFVFKFKNTY